MSDDFQKSGKTPQRFRLVIMNDETFEEVGSYRLSLFNVYSAISTILLFVVLLVVCLIIFTPVKRYIPGYGSNMRSQVLELYDTVDSLETVLYNRNVYIENVRKILSGNVQPTDYQIVNQFMADTIKNIEPIAEELELRDRIAEEELPYIPVNVNNVTNVPDLPKVTFENDDKKPELKYIASPVADGYVTDLFMPDKGHYGVDIAAKKNTPIKSILDGMVIFSDWTLDTGYIIGIQHNHNLLSFYKHNSLLLKKVNSFVKAGEAIAIIGNTGDLSDGPHLHFELWRNGKAVDPTEYIKF